MKRAKQKLYLQMVHMPKKRKRSNLNRELLKDPEIQKTDPELRMTDLEILLINPEQGKCGQDLLLINPEQGKCGQDRKVRQDLMLVLGREAMMADRISVPEREDRTKGLPEPDLITINPVQPAMLQSENLALMVRLKRANPEMPPLKEKPKTKNMISSINWTRARSLRLRLPSLKTNLLKRKQKRNTQNQNMCLKSKLKRKHCQSVPKSSTYQLH